MTVEGDTWIFTSKHLQVRALFLQTCMTVALFLICYCSWFHASTHKHESTLLSTAPVWMGGMAAFLCCRAANVPLPRNVGVYGGSFGPVPLFYTCIAAVCMIKAQGPTCEIYWSPELRLQEMAMPTTPFHLCIWGNQNWGHRGLCNNTVLCNTVYV